MGVLVMIGTKSRSYRRLIIFFTLVFVCLLIGGCSFSISGDSKLARERDHEFDMGSGISLSSISDEKAMDLAKLGKIWGLVKYYHPQVVSGDINWDYELFRIMPDILEDDADVNSILYHWVNSLEGGDYLGSDDYDYRFSYIGIQLKPSTDWCHDQGYLGEDLSNELTNLLNNRISDRENAYVSFTDDSTYHSMDNENPYPNMNADDSGYRLLGLFRYWNIIEYYFPYKDIMGEDWDDVILEFIPKFIQGTDYQSYMLVTAELTTKIHDSHALYVKGKQGYSVRNMFGSYRVPVNSVEIDNQIVISKVNQECGLELGDIVVKVADKNINEFIEYKRKYLSQSRENTMFFSVDLFQTLTKYTDFTVIRGGKTVDIRVKAEHKYYLPVDTKSQAMDDENIYYINAGLLKEGEIDRIMKNWWNTKGLIIDLRNYPSTPIVYELAKYLIANPKEFVVFSLPNQAVPGEFYFLEPNISGRSEGSSEDVYKGKVVILVNEGTGSQGETTTMSLRNAPNSVVLGRPTSGTNGDVQIFKLPGNLETRISGFGVFNPDKAQTQRIGLQPDIYLDPTIEGIKAGRDEYIDRAIEIIKENY